jgi:hypothetical protein
MSGSISEHKGDARPDTLIHLYVKDIDLLSGEFGVPVDEEGLAAESAAWSTRTATVYVLPLDGPEVLRSGVDPLATTAAFGRGRISWPWTATIPLRAERSACRQ